MPRSSSKATPARTATVTRAFLFSDLRGYTDFVEAHGDGAAADLLRAYRDMVRAEVERHAGAEIKTEGDSFYVVFESPSAAIDCAVHIQRAALAHAGRDTKAPIRIGIGVHAGETVPYDDQFVGSAVNVAARLASKAKASEIIASDTLRGLVRTAVRYDMEDRGPLRLKGVGERVRAWSVEWRTEAAAGAMPAHERAPAMSLPLLGGSVSAPAAPVPGQIVCPVVVGRDAERARFAELLALAAGGRGQAVVVSGEAGVGKSAFVRHAISAAGEAGFRVLYGATLESDKGLPYAPFVTAVRSGFRGIARDRLGRVLSQAAPDLAQLFPELGKAQRAESTSAVEQHRLSVAFFGLFATFARETPVLVVVEDLHWADEASLGLFHYLARELRDARVVLLGTYRSDEMHRRHPFLRALGAMQRERLVSEIELGRLDKEQVRALIHATFLQKDPNITVTDEFRDAIYARSEGNPFFTEELLKSLVESGDLYFRAESGWVRDKPIDQLRIPGSVREAVRERIDRLGPEAQTTLSAAAVFGLRVPFELLRAVRGVPESQLEAELRELIEQQLIVELGGDDDEYGFRHALTKEVVYDDLLVRERKRLHHSVAKALASSEESEPALIAHHLVAAGEVQSAIPHLLAAAERAFRAFAPREAAAHYEHAVEIGLPEDQVAATLERLAETYYLYDFALSRKAAEEAADVYRQRGDMRGASRMLRLASRNVWQQGDPARAQVLANEAIAVLAGEESVELGRAVSNLAQLHMTGRRDVEAVEVADRALAIGERFSDAWTISNALITKGTALGNVDGTGVDLIERGRDIAMERGLAETALRAYNNILVRFTQGPEERERMVAEAMSYAERHGIEQPMLKAGKAFGAMLRGDWDETVVFAAQVPEGSFWYDMATASRAHVMLGREGPAPALRAMEPVAMRSLEKREAQGSGPAGVFAAFLLLAGETDRARDVLRRLEQRMEQDPGIGLALGRGAGWFAILAALGLDLDHWVERAESWLPRDPEGAAVLRAELSGAKGLLHRDAAECARGVDALFDAWAERDIGAGPPFMIMLAREALRRGLILGPEWRAPLARSRAYAERARAPWFLSQLDAIEATITDAH